MKLPSLIVYIIMSLNAIATAAEPQSRDQTLAAAKAGRWQEAETDMVALTEATPVDADACSALALRRVQQNRHDDAIALLERAVAAEPKRTDLFLQLGDTIGQRLSADQQDVGDLPARMIGAFERALELDPASPRAHLGLVFYYLNAPPEAGGSIKRAQNYASALAKYDAGLSEFAFSAIADKAGKSEESVAHLRRATELKPKESWLRLMLAQALARTGQVDEARSVYEAVIKAEPNNEPAKAALKALATQKTPASGVR